jgi:hypothetical protein
MLRYGDGRDRHLCDILRCDNMGIFLYNIMIAEADVCAAYWGMIMEADVFTEYSGMPDNRSRGSNNIPW